jgi:hypothetical protein
MKKLIILLVFSGLLCGCEKAGGGARIHFIIGGAARNVVIYCKAGTVTDPGIPLEEYDARIRADGVGEYWYTGVRPGVYFFYAAGDGDGVRVSGSASLLVLRRYRENEYDVVIALR